MMSLPLYRIFFEMKMLKRKPLLAKGRFVKGGRKSCFGFSLAELLVIFAVIGIIAAMTVPTLMAKYQKHVMLVSLKKFYSQMNTVLKTYMASEGCSTLDCTSLYSNNTGCISSSEPEKNYIKKAEKTFSQYIYFKKIPYNSKVKYYEFDGTEVAYGERNFNYYLGYFFQLDGGRIMMLANMCGTSISAGNAYACEQSAVKGVKRCNQVSIDLNGTKPPNKYGYDVFEFMIMNDGRIVPHTGSSRRGHSEQIIKDSWQINYY